MSHQFWAARTRANDAISNGDMDNNDQCAFAGCCTSIEELDRAFTLIGDCMAAAQALEEWSNHAQP